MSAEHGHGGDENRVAASLRDVQEPVAAFGQDTINLVVLPVLFFLNMGTNALGAGKSGASKHGH